MLHLALLAAAMAAPQPAKEPYWGKLAGEKVASVKGKWTSARPPAGLELCIARAFVRGVPSALRDGAGNVVIRVYVQDRPFAEVSLEARPGGSAVELVYLGQTWDTHLPDRIRACL